MATSLAAQLKKLAVPETQSLLTGDFKQASFLYDDHEAATYTKQHFYNIGVNGLQQLIARDDRFVEFEQNLFSQSSQSMQRYVQTSEVNQQLDASINKFLLRLSSYMQLREAHKAMEWMVHRYSVHLRNVDSFMMCLLPYHDQQPFVMGLQLLRMNSNEAVKWKWLEPVKRGGMFLPRQTLVMHCSAAKGFLGFICDMLQKHIEANTDEETGIPHARQLQRMISFFTQIVISVLRNGSPSETTVSSLIPVLTAGLKSHSLPDRIISSYMILGQLFHQTSLAERLLHSLLNVIAKNVQPGLMHSAVTVIVIMFQKQTIAKVPKKAFKYLTRQAHLVSVLREISVSATTEPFLQPFLTMLTTHALKASLSGTGTSLSTGESSGAEDESEDAPAAAPPPISLLVEVFQTFELKRPIVAAVMSVLLSWLSENDVMDLEDESFVDGPFRTFKLVENKYSAFLDDIIEEICSKSEEDDAINKSKAERKKVKSVAESLFKMSVESAQKNLVKDPATTVTICLHHRHSIVRQQAVQTLLRDPSVISDKSSIQSALALKLEDGSADVVLALLDDPKNLWEMFEDKNLLYSSLLKQVSAQTEPVEGWEEVKQKLLKALCWVPGSVGNETEIEAVVLSHLEVCNETDAELAVALLQTPFASRNKLLSHIKKGLQPALEEETSDSGFLDKSADLYDRLINAISTFLLKNPSTALQKLQSLHNCLQLTLRPSDLGFIILSASCSVIKNVDDIESRLSLQRTAVIMLSDMILTQRLFGGMSSASSQTYPKSCLSQLMESGTIPLWFLKHFLEQLAVSTIPNSLKAQRFWCLSDDDDLKAGSTANTRGINADWLQIVTMVVNLLLELTSGQNSEGWHVIAQECFSSFFKVLSDKESVIKFLCMVWMSSERECISAAHKARLLQFAQVYLTSATETDRAVILSEDSPFLPCALILLSSEFEMVRKVTFNLLLSILPKQVETSVSWFTQNLLRFRQEITKDNVFLTQVVKTLLEPEELSPPAAKKRRKSSSRSPPEVSALTWLLDVVCSETTPDRVKAGLLTVLNKLDSVENFSPLVPTLRALVTAAIESLPQEKSQKVSADDVTEERESDKPSPSLLLPVMSPEKQKIIGLLLQRFTPVVAPVVSVDDGSLDTVLKCLRCPALLQKDNEMTSVQMLAIEQLRSKFMSALPAAARKSIVAKLLTLAATSNKAEVVRQCRKVIKHMSLESNIVIEELKSVLSKASAATVREAKRLKIQSSNQGAELESLQWKRVSILLEMLQSKKKLKGAVTVVPVAFQVLGRILDLESDGSGEYLKQLLLGQVNFVCSRQWINEDGEEESVEGSHLNMDLVVQCIRSSDNGHTHHQALLLLSSAAKIAPSLLLHNMMSVFTFMGASILRQDDAYSFHVIGRILDNVIPALLMACEEKSKQKQPTGKSKKKKSTSDLSNAPDEMASDVSSSSGVMTVVLRVFVDAAPHIPAHRRTMLFERLVNVVGADSYLWRLILLYLASVTTRPAGSGDVSDREELAALWPGVEQEKTSGPLSTADLEFLTNLIERFSSSQLLTAFQECLEYIVSLPEEKLSGAPVRQRVPTASLEEMSPEDMAVFSVAEHSPKQLRHFKFAAVYALNHLLASQHILAQLSESDPSTYLPGYRRLLETDLRWISQVSSSLHHHMEDSSRRYWRLLLHKSHDLLDTLVNLLPDKNFFEAVSGLMSHDLGLVQRRAMELLNNRLQQQAETSSPDQSTLLLSLVTKLQTIVSQCLVKSAASGVTEEKLVNGQTALYSLKILCRLLGKNNYSRFIEVLKLSVNVLEKQSGNALVSASAMLCIAEVVHCAGTHSIEHLTLFMPLFVAQLQSDAVTQNDVLLLATITSLQRVIEVVPLFLSPYLKDIVVQICIVSSLIGHGSETHKPVISQKLKAICGTLATVTPTRTFVPVIEKSFMVFEDKLASCAEYAMLMLKEHIVQMSREDMTTFSQDLLKFFFACFDVKATLTELTDDSYDTIEGCVIEAFTTLVFKLSEAQFKPMLLQIYTWATDEDASPNRVLFFYRLCNSLAEKLKSLFTLFAGHILKHSAHILDANNSSKGKCRMFGKGKPARAKSCQLINYVVGCLQKTFAHDTEGFTTKERFDIVMQPLVDQLENTVGRPSASESRAVDHVVPCIASLAAAARDDSLWKDLNYQILLKTRHTEVKVRMWALAAIDAFHKQLGEDYTQLVPEAIPFLAELMEDESDDVEKSTHKVLAAMEVSVGENLQEYF